MMWVNNYIIICITLVLQYTHININLFKVIKAGFVSIRLRDAKLHYIRKSIYLIRKRPRILELGHIAADIELI